MRPLKVTQTSRAERHTMNVVLIISVLLLAFTAFAFYRWSRKPSSEDTEHYLMPPRSGGLFSHQGSVSANAPATNATADTDKQIAERRAALIKRAAEGDQSTLAEAHMTGDATLYREVLDALTARASENSEHLHALAARIKGSGELRASAMLAAGLIEAWRQAPERPALVEMLHIAALADDAAIYQQAIEVALQVWRDGRLPQISSEELHALIENEYWTLASEAKRSGEGFVLKRMLVSVRRELATAKPRASAE
jgi:hypothetical protein